MTPWYTVTDLGTFGGGYADAWAINAEGAIVGHSLTTSTCYDDYNLASRSFKYENGTLNYLGSPSYVADSMENNWAFGINDNPSNPNYPIVVGAYQTSDIYQRAYKNQAGFFTILEPLSGNTYAVAVNTAGYIVGNSLNSSGVSRAVRWNSGSTQADDLEALVVGDDRASYAFGINVAGKVVGKSITSQGVYHAYRTGALVDIDDPGSVDLGTISGTATHSSEARSINDADEIAGGSHNSSGQYHAFYRSAAGVFTDLGTLGGTWSLGYGINKSGQVVGSANTASGNGQAFAALYKGWAVMQNLNHCIQPGGWDLRAAHSINESGKIVGWAYIYGSPRAFLLTPQ